MKKLAAVLLALCLVISFAACGEKEDTKTGYKIGIIQLTEHAALDADCEGIIKALDDSGIDYTVDIQNAQGEQSNCATIVNKFINDDVDLIICIATPAAQAAAAATTQIPIIFTAVTDAEAAGLVASNAAPGGNVTGVSDMNPVEAQINLLKTLIPDAKTIGIMYCSSEDNSIVQAGMAEAQAIRLGLTVQHLTAADSSEVAAVALSAVGKVDAVYMPTDNLMADTIGEVSTILTAGGVPIIAGEGNMVSGGALATYGIDYYKLGIQTGEMAVKILQGADTATTPVGFALEADLSTTINTTAASALGITIPSDLVYDAVQ